MISRSNFSCRSAIRMRGNSFSWQKSCAESRIARSSSVSALSSRSASSQANGANGLAGRTADRSCVGLSVAPAVQGARAGAQEHEGWHVIAEADNRGAQIVVARGSGSGGWSSRRVSRARRIVGPRAGSAFRPGAVPARPARLRACAVGRRCGGVRRRPVRGRSTRRRVPLGDRRLPSARGLPLGFAACARCVPWLRAACFVGGASSAPPFAAAPLAAVLSAQSTGSSASTTTGGMAWPISFSICSTAKRSSGEAMVNACPSRPARPVRPMRCT